MSVDGLTFNAPATDTRIESLLTRLAVDEGSCVLDVGCGRGAMLSMLAESTGCHGVGVDPKGTELTLARQRTPARGTVTWHEAAFGDVELDHDFDAALCIGATHACGPPGQAMTRTIEMLTSHTRPGGRLLIGEGYWKRPPPTEYMTATGFAPHHLHDHETNMAAGTLAETARDVTLLHAETSTDDEWDAFENAFLVAAEARVATAPDDADAIANVEHWRAWNAAYRQWGRDTLGFGFYLFET